MPRCAHIPVIMISAVSELDSVVRCIELGAEDYLPKPFNWVLLRARIGASLERKRLHDREAAHLAEIDRQRAARRSSCCTPSCRRRRCRSSRPAIASRPDASRTWRSCSATWSGSRPTASATRPRRWSPTSTVWLFDLGADRGRPRARADQDHGRWLHGDRQSARAPCRPGDGGRPLRLRDGRGGRGAIRRAGRSGSASTSARWSRA